MAAIDIIILIIIGIGVLRGVLKGFLKQLAGVLGLVVGLLAAKALYATVAERFCPLLTDNMTFAQVLAFILIWLAVPLLFLLVASLLAKAMEAVSLGWVNRLLGAVLGALKYGLVVSLLVCVMEYIDADNRLIDRTKKQESVLYYPMKTLAVLFFPAAKEITEQFYNEINDATERSI